MYTDVIVKTQHNTHTHTTPTWKKHLKIKCYWKVQAHVSVNYITVKRRNLCLPPRVLSSFLEQLPAGFKDTDLCLQLTAVHCTKSAHVHQNLTKCRFQCEMFSQTHSPLPHQPPKPEAFKSSSTKDFTKRHQVWESTNTTTISSPV